MVLTQYVLALILSLRASLMPGETVDAHLATMVDVSAAIAESVNASAPVYRGRFGRARTAALMVAIGYKESGFRADILSGATLGPNRACGAWQTETPPLPCALFVLDRRFEAEHALALVRRSFAACRHNPRAHWLAGFTSGRVDAGLVESRERMNLADRLFASVAPVWLEEGA